MQEQLNIAKATVGKSIEADAMKAIGKITKLSEELIGVTDQKEIDRIKGDIDIEKAKLPDFAATVAAKVERADSGSGIRPVDTAIGQGGVGNTDTAQNVSSAQNPTQVINVNYATPGTTVEAKNGSTSASIPSLSSVKRFF
jgi:hypothetical protein